MEPAQSSHMAGEVPPFPLDRARAGSPRPVLAAMLATRPRRS